MKILISTCIIIFVVYIYLAFIVKHTFQTMGIYMICSCIALTILAITLEIIRNKK